MSTPRRLGSEESASRAALLDAALALMLEEGYAAVTSRRVAAKAGLKHQLVHYYFRTMDDLFIALIRRGGERALEQQELALASPQPLRALWELSSDPTGTAFVTEFSALANHREAVGAEWARYAGEFRRRQSDGVVRVLETYGIDPRDVPHEAVSVLMNSVSRILAMEEAVGVTVGHAETRALVERWLARHEGDAPGPTTEVDT